MGELTSWFVVGLFVAVGILFLTSTWLAINCWV
jgi:hypothetical protein